MHRPGSQGFNGFSKMSAACSPDKAGALSCHIPTTTCPEFIYLSFTCSVRFHLCVPAVSVLHLKYMVLTIISPLWNIHSPVLSHLTFLQHFFFSLEFYKCSFINSLVYLCVWSLCVCASYSPKFCDPSARHLEPPLLLSHTQDLPPVPPALPPRALSLIRQINCWHH